MDPRYLDLARVLIRSTGVQAGEHALIEAYASVDGEFLIEALMKELIQRGVGVVLEYMDKDDYHLLYDHANEERYRERSAFEIERMKRQDAFFGIRGWVKDCDKKLLVPGAEKLYQRYISQAVHHDIRLKDTHWVVSRWFNEGMAERAGMGMEAFKDFYFNVCTMDYDRMTSGMEALKQRMERTDLVRILGPETKLQFSIKDIPAIPCGGVYNIPDGECFTAPVRKSVNGVIAFNTPTTYLGDIFEDVVLEFKDGRIEEATAKTSQQTARLQEILFETDEGARYVGEFALGFNPFITRPMLDILFDEKIAGSFHFTPGNAYENADNTNRSQIHWDMVMIQTPEYGGGEIWLDGEMIRKDGRFVPDYLQPLNPENLK